MIRKYKPHSDNIKDYINIDVFDKVYDMLRVIRKPISKAILSLLFKEGPTSVTGIYTKLRTDQSIASTGLKELMKYNLVLYEQDGKFHFYSANKVLLEKLNVSITILMQ